MENPLDPSTSLISWQRKEPRAYVRHMGMDRAAAKHGKSSQKQSPKPEWEHLKCPTEN